MSRYWRAPALWPNETVFIVGGGPTLKALDLSPLSKSLAGRRTIAVNNAFRLFQNPDVIFYADTRWWGWNGKDIAADFGGRIVSTCSAGVKYLDGRVSRMGRDYRYDPRHQSPEQVCALAEDPTMLSGPDSGYMAMNLAYHLGASRIVLLGFDMGFTEGAAHWHDDHPVPTPESNYTDLFFPRYPALIESLKKRGVEVIRCTPSRLDFVPEVPFADALALSERRRT